MVEADERREPDRADETRRRGQCEQVVATQEPLADDVVERERERCPEDDERALRALERQVFA